MFLFASFAIQKHNSKFFLFLLEIVSEMSRDNLDEINVVAKRTCKYFFAHIQIINQQLFYSLLHHAFLFVTIDNIIHRFVFSSYFIRKSQRTLNFNKRFRTIYDFKSCHIQCLQIKSNFYNFFLNSFTIISVFRHNSFVNHNRFFTTTFSQFFDKSTKQ